MILTTNNGTVVEVQDSLNNAPKPQYTFTLEQVKSAERMMRLAVEVASRLQASYHFSAVVDTHNTLLKVQCIKMLREKWNIGLGEAKTLYETAQVYKFPVRDEYKPF